MTFLGDICKNRDNTKCLDIDPDTFYKLPVVEEKIAQYMVRRQYVYVKNMQVSNTNRQTALKWRKKGVMSNYQQV